MCIRRKAKIGVHRPEKDNIWNDCKIRGQKEQHGLRPATEESDSREIQKLSSDHSRVARKVKYNSSIGRSESDSKILSKPLFRSRRQIRLYKWKIVKRCIQWYRRTSLWHVEHKEKPRLWKFREPKHDFKFSPVGPTESEVERFEE